MANNPLSINVDDIVHSCPDCPAFIRLLVGSCPNFPAFIRLIVRSGSVLCTFIKLFVRLCQGFHAFFFYPAYVNLIARHPRCAFVSLDISALGLGPQPEMAISRIGIQSKKIRLAGRFATINDSRFLDYIPQRMRGMVDSGPKLHSN